MRKIKIVLAAETGQEKIIGYLMEISPGKIGVEAKQEKIKTQLNRILYSLTAKPLLVRVVKEVDMGNGIIERDMVLEEVLPEQEKYWTVLADKISYYSLDGQRIKGIMTN